MGQIESPNSANYEEPQSNRLKNEKLCVKLCRGLWNGIRGLFRGMRREAITLFTFSLVIVGVLQWNTLEKTDETLRLEQRAWLEFVGAEFAVQPQKDAALRFRLNYVNSGRQPATSANIIFDTSEIDPFVPMLTDMRDVHVPENTTCSRVNPLQGQAVYPPTLPGTFSFVNENSINGNPKLFADDKFLDGEKFYVIEGCAAYMTQGATKHSSLCYIIHKATFDVTDLNGNIIASPPPEAPPPPRSYIFETCAAGFYVD